jgi:hippurate hydrolase
MRGTARGMKRETLTAIESALRRIAGGVASGLGASAEVDFRLIFAPLVNAAEATREYVDAAVELVGESRVDQNKAPISASEDFSFMLEHAPGAYMNLGNGEASAPLHNPRYDFNDDALPFGAALFARIVQRKLVRELPPP